MVAKTTLGTALLLKVDQEEKCLPIYLGSQGAYPILQALEGKETRSTTELFLRTAAEEGLELQHVELRERDKNLEALFYRKDRPPVAMALLDSLLLAIRGGLPILSEKELYESRAIFINLQDSAYQKRIQDLEERLNQAVLEENYEEAALLRDQIHALQKEQQPAGGA